MCHRPLFACPITAESVSSRIISLSASHYSSSRFPVFVIVRPHLMEPNVHNPKRRAKRRNYDVKSLSVIPGVPETAARYRLSPSEMRQTLLLSSTYSSPSDPNSSFHSPSPTMSYLSISPLLSLAPLDSRKSRHI
ncbi:hypothetical protein B0H12DRAFT_1157129 [Mycena haematopus]|nr:hypothetical protein B0H12DRAFT_1157129 [Mycena haematopus]